VAPRHFAGEREPTACFVANGSPKTAGRLRRLHGFLEAMRKHGLSVREELIASDTASYVVGETLEVTAVDAVAATGQVGPLPIWMLLKTNASGLAIWANLAERPSDSLHGDGHGIRGRASNGNDNRD
jgi:hypothetical protein